MNLSSIAIVVDTEYDDGKLIEIGLTTVSIKDHLILQSYSIPIKINFELSQEIQELTGWTNKKLERQGVTIEEACRRLDKYGFQNRLIVIDTNDELEKIEQMKKDINWNTEISKNRLNISILFFLKTGIRDSIGLDKMLEYFGLVFEGKRHRANSDSYNIAKLFIRLIEE
jgi:inhibitor of KinA sporulation pathway (predicted exonuclease)